MDTERKKQLLAKFNNRRSAGKMSGIRFYVCTECGNIITSAGEADISCCGKRLCPLEPAEADDMHGVAVTKTDGDYYVTLDHEMRKEHYILFAADASDDRVWLHRLYPEQSCAFRIPASQGKGALYLYCVKHGLFKYPVLPI